MSPRMSAVSRTGYFLVMVVLGAAMPFGEGCSNCPEFDPDPEYRVLNDRGGWVPGSGSLRVTDSAFVVSYTTVDGSKWEVEYRRTDEPLSGI